MRQKKTIRLCEKCCRPFGTIRAVTCKHCNQIAYSERLRKIYKGVYEEVGLKRFW